jgi:hypothetical protein
LRHCRRKHCEEEPALNLETAKATLECARADVADEHERARSLDGKLVSIASFSGVALSISAAVGASVVVSGGLALGFAIALGAVLSVAALLLLGAAMVALVGISPKSYAATSTEAAAERVTRKRLAMEPAWAIGELAATYNVSMLPKARKVNEAKVKAVRRALYLVGGGLGGLVAALILSAIAAVV